MHASEQKSEFSTEEHIGSMKGGQSNILVAVRVRPALKHDRVRKEVVRTLDRHVIVVIDPSESQQDVLRVNRSKEKQYAFDYVFNPEESQDTIYEFTTKPLIQGVLDGFNATVFAYGCTGAGKTFTMIGTDNQPGIMVMTLRDLFREAEAFGRARGVTYRACVSFLEVYNENIRDLLASPTYHQGQNGIGEKCVDEYLDLREDPIRGPTVAGITEIEAKSSDDVMDLLHRGNRNRSQHPTAANEVSSRSHAVLQVVVECRDKTPGIVANYRIGKLSLVDLAGSERAANTQNRGIRLQEGANINRSLLALGNCINALSNSSNGDGKSNFVPYRDSKLTRLLKDSLGGNCRTVMIACIGPSESNFEETLNTLKYANRAKNIKTTIQRNVLDVNYHISEYVNLINNLRNEIGDLKKQLASAQPTGSDGKSVLNRSPRKYNPSVSLPIEDRPINRSNSVMTEDPSHEADEAGADQAGGSAQAGLASRMRADIILNFQERMQLKRSMIEIEDQITQNESEIRRYRSSSDRSEEQLNCIVELEAVLSKNIQMKKSLVKRLKRNEQQAEEFRHEIATKISEAEKLELMEMQYQVGRLELENMELEQQKIVFESILSQKDVKISKLETEVSLLEKIVKRQAEIIASHAFADQNNPRRHREEDSKRDSDKIVPANNDSKRRMANRRSRLSEDESEEDKQPAGQLMIISKEYEKNQKEKSNFPNPLPPANRRNKSIQKRQHQRLKRLNSHQLRHQMSNPLVLESDMGRKSSIGQDELDIQEIEERIDEDEEDDDVEEENSAIITEVLVK